MQTWNSIPMLVLAALGLVHWYSPLAADSKPAQSDSSTPAVSPVKSIPPKPIWDRFLILVWQYKTSAPKDLPLYREGGFHAFHIDRGANKKAIVDFAKENQLPYYVDHAADKGFLHLSEAAGRNNLLRKSAVLTRPNSLASPETMEKMKTHLRNNISITREGPVVAYSFDDEPSVGVMNAPCETDGSPDSVAGYRKWLETKYRTVEALNRVWNTTVHKFSEIQPVSFEDIRQAKNKPPFRAWNLSRWMDWRSYMDVQFADCLAELTRYSNELDPNTPAGITGAQQPAPYGGYDYARLYSSIQWIEAYDIGGTCEILRSLWNGPERRPYLQTWFSRGDPKPDSWFLWYYLLHGCRGVIAWPDRNDSWFHSPEGSLAPYIKENVSAIQEVQGAVSETILHVDTWFDADPIAVYYSHPSIQASWVMDAATHGRTWPNRSSSMDNSNQTAGKNRVAWFKLLEDCGLQYNVVTADQVVRGELLSRRYKVLILNRVIAMSESEAAAIRAFVQQGGIVIADHLTGILDENGKGRTEGGILDEMFGIRRDESRGYLDGKHITEIDGERYQKPFLDRLNYKNCLRLEGIPLYERSTLAAEGISGTRVETADAMITKSNGAGRSIYLNLTPVAYNEEKERTGSFGDQWRKIIRKILADSGVHLRAKVLSSESPIPLAELLYWRNKDKLLIGLIMNPSRQADTQSEGAMSQKFLQSPIDIEIVLRKPVTHIMNLRTSEKLPDGNRIVAKWPTWEGLLFQVQASPDLFAEP